MNQLNLDLQFGNMNEISVLEIIKKHFNDETIKKVEKKYSVFDFEGKNSRYELKSRRCESKTYLDTMVGVNKLESVGDNFIFLFKFTDGLFYIKYEKEIFDKFRRGKGGRYDRGRPEIKDYLFIPKERLTKIEPPVPSFV